MFRASKFAFVDTLVAIVSDVKIFLFFLFLTLLVRIRWLHSQSLSSDSIFLTDSLA